MEKNNLKAARTTAMVKARLETVSPFTQRVWSALVIELPTEKGLAVVSSTDLAKTLGVKTMQIVGAVHNLTRVKLAYREKIKPIDGKPYTGIGVFLRDAGGGAWFEYREEIVTVGIPAASSSKKAAKKVAKKEAKKEVKKAAKKASKPIKKTQKNKAETADPTDSVQGSALTQALRLLNVVADQKASMQCLADVRIESHEGNLILRTTDLNIHLEASLPYAEKYFAACVNAKALGKMVATKGKQQGERVKFNLADDKLAVETHGIQVRLDTSPEDVFPAFPKEDWEPVAEWSSEAFASALEYVLPAISVDETRPHINTLALQDGKAIATDGHRMHWAPTPTETDRALLIPRAAAKVLVRFIGLADKVAISSCEWGLLFQAGNWRMVCRLSDTQFPPYDQVIPKNQPGNVLFETEVFANAVKKLRSMASNATEGLVLEWAESLKISADNPELGEASVELCSRDCQDGSPELRIGVRATYLLDAVAKSEEFELHYGDGLDPMVIRDGERGAVVMPMRV